MPQRARGAGEPCDDEGLAGAGIVQSGVQLGPGSEFARRLVDEDLVAVGVGQRVALGAGVLVKGADPYPIFATPLPSQTAHPSTVPAIDSVHGF
jgi:hypothetical protein